MNYPASEHGEMEYCITDDSHPYRWERVKFGGSWFPDAFVGTMASVMKWADSARESGVTAVDDVGKTVVLVRAGYRSSERCGEQIVHEYQRWCNLQKSIPSIKYRRPSYAALGGL